MRKLLSSTLLIPTLSGCLGYVPGQQSYWDAQVRELCVKDGGVQVFEQIVVPADLANALPKVGKFIGVASEKLAKPYEPAFTRTHRTVLHESNPSVIRYEQEIVRRSDQQVVGVAISYGRGGGDFPSIAEPSSFHCPVFEKIYEGIHKIYKVK